MKIWVVVWLLLQHPPSKLGLSFLIAQALHWDYIHCIIYLAESISQCEPGNIRLQSRTGRNPAVGRIQICNSDGRWLREVCGESHWDENSAKVVCRQLGFSDAGIVRHAHNNVLTNLSSWH